MVASLVGRYSVGDLVLIGLFVTAVAMTVRFVWVYPVAYLPRWLSGSLREQEPEPRQRELFIISWCGMRGIVSLAAALALPHDLARRPAFPASRPDHLPDLLRHRRDPDRARPDSGAADPHG